MYPYEELKELSLNILDIAQNSIRANSTLIEISVIISTAENSLIITVKDDGCGFDTAECEKRLQKVDNSNRNNGLGLLLLKNSAEKTGGKIELCSKKGSGTEIKAFYILNSPLRPPLGDVEETVEALMFCCKDIHFIFTFKQDAREFVLDTVQIKDILGKIPIDTPEVKEFIKEYLKENINFLKG